MSKENTRISLFGCPIDVLTLDETLEKIDMSIRENIHIHHALVNVATIVNLQNDKLLRDGIVNCDLINADGQGVLYAAKALGLYLPERVSGPDLMEKIVALAYDKSYKIYFLGAEENIVKKVVENYSNKYSSSIVAGFRNGYFSKEEEPFIVDEIAITKPNILFVAMTSPKKEDFLFRHKSIFKNINFITGVGGCFDIVAGKTRRAPYWMQKNGLEWIFRLSQEPSRLFKRYLVTNFLMLKMIIFNRINIKNRVHAP